jgi:hypothetical protein
VTDKGGGVVKYNNRIVKVKKNKTMTKAAIGGDGAPLLPFCPHRTETCCRSERG